MGEEGSGENGGRRPVDAGILEKPVLSNEYVYGQALAIVEAAQKRGVALRLIGATAFVHHCPAHRSFYTESTRQLTDVDVVTYSRYSGGEIEETFRKLGYEPLRAYAWHTESRDIFVNAERLYVDVFKDVLSFCHPISFRGRLEVDSPTVPVSDLLLEKLQIVEINEKDLKDVAILLAEHGFEGPDRETLDVPHLLSMWSNDWGFYYTATTNLGKVRGYLGGMAGLDAADAARVTERIGTLLERIEAAPKSLRWRVRARVGAKVKWYNQVDSMQR